MYFYLQTSELLSGKAFNSMSDILHFDMRNVSLILILYGVFIWDREISNPDLVKSNWIVFQVQFMDKPKKNEN